MTLPMPSCHHEAQAQAADSAFAPLVAKIAEEAVEYFVLHDLRPVSEDVKKVHLLVIDAQVDFSFPDGALYVAGRSGAGAIDANRHLVEFIYRNLDLISRTSICPTPRVRTGCC